MSSEIEVFEATIVMRNDPDAVEINDEHELFMNSLHTSLDHVVKCGELLRTKKASLAYGDWMPWAKQNLKFKLTQAERYMRLAEESSSGMIPLNEYNSIQKALRTVAKHREPRPEKEFDWSADTRVKAMLNGLKATRQCLPILFSTNKDRTSAEYYIKMAKENLIKIFNMLLEYERNNETDQAKVNKD